VFATGGIGGVHRDAQTVGLTVLVFGSERFPAFWLSDSGFTMDTMVNSAAEVAATSAALGLPGGVLVANPLPESAQLDPALARLHPSRDRPLERRGQPRDRPRELPARR
jgi:pseudouridine-5'-phosphate glycosidase